MTSYAPIGLPWLVPMANSNRIGPIGAIILRLDI